MLGIFSVSLNYIRYPYSNTTKSQDLIRYTGKEIEILCFYLNMHCPFFNVRLDSNHQCDNLVLLILLYLAENRQGCKHNMHRTQKFNCLRG